MWKPLAEEDGVGVRLDVLDHELLAVAVPGALEQILDNLLDNSLAAAPVDTAIELRSGAPRSRSS